MIFKRRSRNRRARDAGRESFRALARRPSRPAFYFFRAAPKVLANKIRQSMGEENHPSLVAAKHLQADRPTIECAMKNWISVLTAQGIGAQASEETPATPAASHELAHVVDLAKIVLKTINALTLADPSQFNVAHPQEETEDGSARLEMLTQYKAAFLLLTQCHSAQAKDAKPSKLFGRAFLRATRCWDDSLCASAAAAIAASPKAKQFPEHTVRAFLDGWGDALQGSGDADLVWSVDFQAALGARRSARRQEVAERAKRMDSTESEADMLRAALNAERAEAPQEQEEEQRVVDVTEQQEAASKAGDKQQQQQKQKQKQQQQQKQLDEDEESEDDDDDDDDGPDEHDKPRVWEVPLSPEAEAMLAALPPGTKLGGSTVK